MALRSPSPGALLRAAAVLALLYCLGHMAGYPWTPAETEPARAVVAQMQSVRFEAVGAERSYWDFYFGFGLISGADLALLSAFLWWTARVADRDSALVEPILSVMLIALAVNAYLTFRYFFVIPMAFAVLIAALIAAALAKSARVQSAARASA